MRGDAAWVAVFLLGTVGLNWPVLGIFGDGVYVYLLLFWLLLVLLLSLGSRGNGRPVMPAPGDRPAQGAPRGRGLARGRHR